MCPSYNYRQISVLLIKHIDVTRFASGRHRKCKEYYDVDAWPCTEA